MIANGICECHPRFIWEVDRIFYLLATPRSSVSYEGYSRE